MTDVTHLAQDLRAEAHTAPPKARDLMREAAGVLDRYKHFLSLADADVRPPPIAPPDMGGKHRRPERAESQ